MQRQLVGMIEVLEAVETETIEHTRLVEEIYLQKLKVNCFALDV